jgi:hypothetical protein
MKKFTLLSLFFVVFLTTFNSQNSCAQTAPNYQELIVQIPVVITREFSQLKADIIALGAIQFINYCESEQCLMLKMDRNVHLNDTALLNLLKTKNLPFEVKTDATIAQAMSQCTSDPANPNGPK